MRWLTMRAPTMPTRTMLARMVPALTMAALVVSPAVASAQDRPAGMAAIREADLRRDLHIIGGDAFRGREGGSIDELRASVWVAEELRKIGLEPMGDDGSYFQWWDIRRTRVGASSTVRIGDRSFAMWDDIAVASNNTSQFEAPTVWAGDGRDTSVDVRGKVAIAQLVPPTTRGRETSVNSPEYRYARSAMQSLGLALTRRGAVAVVLIADSTAEIAFEGVANIAARGTYRVDAIVPGGAGAGGTGGRGGAAAAAGGAGGAGGRGAAAASGVAPPPTFLVRQREGATLRALAGQPMTVRLHLESFTYPSVNIVARVRGTDARLRDEHVLFSTHQDHDGVRYDVSGDSIWNGADDNGTGMVALLAAARAFQQQPARRSALFVYHGAEERGLLGSNYHVQNPVVPLEQIVAVLNAEMMGRNHPDSASLLGIQPPHLNSADLVAHALRANTETARFQLDSLWDRPTHPEGWYFRSDHLPYARLNVPAVMFTSNLHPDYHTPKDEPDRIDYAKLTRMTQWLYLTGWHVANAPERPRLVPGFRLER